MSGDSWMLKRPSGEQWGTIKRLIIDSATRQITYADVIVGDTGELLRIPWDRFQIGRHWISLNMPEGSVHATIANEKRLNGMAMVAIDVRPSSVQSQRRPVGSGLRDE
jgi:PRC-barrel domain